LGFEFCISCENKSARALLKFILTASTFKNFARLLKSGTFSFINKLKHFFKFKLKESLVK